MLRPLLIFWHIVFSLRYRTKPWNFFQLNSYYFDTEKNIFSKFDLDQQIPAQWRLDQVIDDGKIVPEFPVFIKPEWGQNSHGVGLARDLSELNFHRKKRAAKKVSFLLQAAAKESLEYEIFYIRSPENQDQPAILSVTETLNLSDDSLVVNGIFNSDSLYQCRNKSFKEDELDRLWSLIKEIGCFRIGRVGLRTDSIQDMLSGRFHVIEVNIFLPMPLVLLDRGMSWPDKHRFIRQSMKVAARLAKVCGAPEKRAQIFFRKMIAHYKVKE